MLLTTVLLNGILASTVPQIAQMQTSMPGFIRYDDQLRKDDVAVVVGRLAKMRTGKRERLKDDEADLGTGNVVSRVSGTVFYKVQCRGTLAVDQPLHGTEAKSLKLEFEIQSSTRPSGQQQQQFRTHPKFEAEDDMLALFVLEKNARRSTWNVIGVLPMDPKLDRGDDKEKAFAKRAGDCHAINHRLAQLAQALEQADVLRERETAKAAAETLRKALDEKLVLTLPESESPRSMYVKPLELRVREALERLEPTGRKGGETKIEKKG